MIIYIQNHLICRYDFLSKILLKFLKIFLYCTSEQGRVFSIIRFDSVTRLPFLASTFRQCIDRSVKRIPAKFVFRIEKWENAGKGGKENTKKNNLKPSLRWICSRETLRLALVSSHAEYHRRVSSARRDIFTETLAGERSSEIYSERRQRSFKSPLRRRTIYSRTCKLTRLLYSRRHTRDDLSRQHRRLDRIDFEKK